MSTASPVVRIGRPPIVRTLGQTIGRLGAVLLLAVGSVLGAPRAASACSGGTAFDWAVQHSLGGIIRAHVDSVSTRPDFTTDLVLSAPSVIRGEPVSVPMIHAVAGAICEQSADPGETVLVLFDIRGGNPPYPWPLFYVVDGTDALSASVVSDGLSTTPATDTAVTPASRPATDWWTTGVLVSSGLLGALLAIRRWRRASSSAR